MSSSQLETEAVLTRFYTIAGRLLSFEPADPWAAQATETFLAGFHLAPSPGPDTGQADCRVKVVTGTPPPVPPHLQVFEVEHGLCHTDGNSYYLDIDESRIIVGPPEARTVSVWLGETWHARHRVALANVMSYVLQAALRRSALYDLHAAGVVEPSSGTGVLLIGTSNSGKSSLTVRLVLSGWRYLSDDMMVLNETPDGIEARGLRSIFAVSARVLAGCQMPRLEEALGATIPSDPNKRCLEPSIVFPNSFAPVCVPAMLCFPMITGEAVSRLERMEQAEAMTRLIRHCPWSSYDTSAARSHLRVLSRLVRQTVAYRLFAGRDMLTTARCASDLLISHLN